MSKEYETWLRTAAKRYGLPSDAFDGMITSPIQPEVEVKWNILANHEWCPLCDRNVCIDIGPWPFMRGTPRPVCRECAAERGVREPFECGRDEKPNERREWRTRPPTLS
jgi:hypothetical protein